MQLSFSPFFSPCFSPEAFIVIVFNEAERLPQAVFVAATVAARVVVGSKYYKAVLYLLCT